MRYEAVAAACGDLERASGRLEMIDRLARLFDETPPALLPTVVLLCLGRIAPDFAGVDIGLAERLAARAVARAAGVAVDEVLDAVREVGDLGLAAERLLAQRGVPAASGPLVQTVFDTLHEIAAAAGTGSQGRKLDLMTGLLVGATPLSARYLVRTVTGTLRVGIGPPTVLDALAQVYAGGRRARPVLERAYNICSDLGLVASTLVDGGLAAVELIHVRAGSPVRPVAAQRLSSTEEVLAKLGGRCAAEYKYDGIRLQAHRTADGRIELFTRRLERVSTQFPDGGDCGYMTIFQVADMDDARAHLNRLGIRAVFDADLDDIRCTHLHPADLGAAFVSFDQAIPEPSRRWAGPAWQTEARTGAFTGLARVRFRVTHRRQP